MIDGSTRESEAVHEVAVSQNPVATRGVLLRHAKPGKRLKPQCLLAIEMNGQPLSEVYGAPLRLRVENQLGYKTVKWIERIEFVESEKMLGKGEDGKNEDDEFFDLLPNI